ncbi:tRNA methyltransferase [Candidatus Uhrbacteria bacterium]|nr:tRNA methyltransferase [Candidatus Uhrbacteria bacterium]
MTKERKKKMETVLAKRQPGLMVVMENVDDPHNVGAILRSCDAFGVLDVHLLYTNGRTPRMKELKSRAAASTLKWLRVTKWNSVSKLVKELKKKKIKIAVTTLLGKTKDPVQMDLTQPVALVIGNEHAGASKEIVKAADLILKIPMNGFVESFNVSVATALLLYEAFRQREKKGMYDQAQMTKKEQAKVLKMWGKK